MNGKTNAKQGIVTNTSHPIIEGSVFDSFGADCVHEIARSYGNVNIARGAFGEISLAIFRSSEAKDGEQQDTLRVAVVKSLFQPTVAVVGRGWGDSAEQKKLVNREVFHEVRSLRLLQSHPNIVQLLALYPSRQHFDQGLTHSFVFEYCPVDLHLVLEWRRCSFKPLLPIEVVGTIAKDIFAALWHCHSSGIVHRDVKPGNLLVSSNGVIKLCDFGLSVPLTGTEIDTTFIPTSFPEATSSSLTETRGLCTLHYRAPELLFGAPGTEPSLDIYGAGLVVAELLSGRPLFPGRNDLDQLAIIFSFLGTPSDDNWPAARELSDYGKIEFASKSPKPIDQFIPRAVESDHLVSFLEKTVALDPERRMTSLEALNHPWLSGVNVAGKLSRRCAIMQELIPKELDEPILFDMVGVGENDYELPTTKVVHLATARRQLLPQLVEPYAAKSFSLS